jgi:hypothetical protein
MCAFALSTKKQLDKSRMFKSTKNLLTRLVENPPNIYWKTVGYSSLFRAAEMSQLYCIFFLLDNFKIKLFARHTVDRF